jgi:hypothetical protein
MGFFCHEMVIYQGFDGDLPDIQWRIWWDLLGFRGRMALDGWLHGDFMVENQGFNGDLPEGGEDFSWWLNGDWMGMGLKQCHKSSPKSPEIGGINHSQMGGLWHCFTHIGQFMMTYPLVNNSLL